MSFELLDSQLPKNWTMCQQTGDSIIQCFTEWAEGLYTCRAVYFAEIIIETNMEVPLILPDQLVREFISPHNVKHLWRVQFIGFYPAHYGLTIVMPRSRRNVVSGV